MTVIVGRPSDTGTCRIFTCSDVTESNKVEVKVPSCPSPDERKKEASQDLAGVPKWAHYVLGVVALMNENGNIPGFDAVVASCVPLGGGLSSSASLEVATYLFVQELCQTKKIELPVYGKTQVCLHFCVTRLSAGGNSESGCISPSSEVQCGCYVCVGHHCVYIASSLSLTMVA